MLFLQGGGFLGLDEIQANRISDGAMLWSTPYERTDNPRVLDADAIVLRPVIANRHAVCNIYARCLVRIWSIGRQ